MSKLRVPKRSIVSRYGSSPCRYCNNIIEKGDVIRSGDKGWGHHKCVVSHDRAEAAAARLDENADAANERRWTTE